MEQKVKIYKNSDKLDFGKYKGYSLSMVMKENQDYIWWCLKNISWFKITNHNKIYKEIKEEINRVWKNAKDELEYSFYSEYYGDPTKESIKRYMIDNLISTKYKGVSVDEETLNYVIGKSQFFNQYDKCKYEITKKYEAGNLLSDVEKRIIGMMMF